MKSDCCLLDCKTATLPGFDHAVVGDNMDCFGMHLSVDDIVTHSQAMGRICACISELDNFLVIVEPLRHVGYISTHCLRCQPTGRLKVWRALELEPVCAWMVYRDGIVDVVL